MAYLGCPMKKRVGSRGNGRPGGLTHDKRDQGFAAANLESPPVEIIEKIRQLANLSPDDPPEMETPDALAGATGAKGIEQRFQTQEYRSRAAAATALGLAIADCHPEDAVVLMEAALDDLRAGLPGGLPGAIMAEARFWAEVATRTERKAYALAAYSRLSAADQSAFLAHVGGRLQ
ncbi:MAG: hypothetical protein ACK5UA_11715 [Cereibacter sp.]